MSTRKELACIDMEYMIYESDSFNTFFSTLQELKEKAKEEGYSDLRVERKLSFGYYDDISVSLKITGEKK